MGQNMIKIASQPICVIYVEIHSNRSKTFRPVYCHCFLARSTRANFNNGLCFDLKVIIFCFHSLRFASYRHLQAFWRQIEPATRRIVRVGTSSTSSTTAAPDKAADPPRRPVGTFHTTSFCF